MPAESTDAAEQPAAVVTGHVPGSFPWTVFHDRHPKVLRQLREAVPFGPDQLEELQRLEEETLNGVISRLRPDAHDYDAWDASGREYYGKSWTDAPFLWAESFFYRRLLAATGYFTPGPWYRYDPFSPLKDAELRSPEADRELAAYDQVADLTPADRDAAMLTMCLWGNRADIGFQMIAGRAEGQDGSLLVNEGDAFWAHLRSGTPGIVNLIADNAARELLPDLMLLDYLLAAGLATKAVLHLKPGPYYVSDATTADACAALLRLVEAPDVAGEAGRRLWQARTDGRLEITAAEFFCSPETFHNFPADLVDRLAESRMTLVKGDLNFRRLVDDRLWPATTSFSELTAYFPGPVTALRTCKSEVVVGMTAEAVAQLDSTEPQWRFSGSHAVIHVRVPAAA